MTLDERIARRDRLATEIQRRASALLPGLAEATPEEFRLLLNQGWFVDTLREEASHAAA
jgi:hypothetical protein